MRGGAITDFEVTERMLSVLLRRVGVSRLNRPKVLICVPSAITAVERRAVKEAARRAGASASFLIEQPMAAAIGAGLAIHEPVGNMVVDVGGGTSEMAVISLGGVVAVRAMRCGGFDFDASIQAYVRHEYGVAIGERTAEAVKLAIGSALAYAGEQQAEIRGREVATGRPKTVVLSPTRCAAALEDNVTQVIDGRGHCLGEAPPELAQDIMFQGIHLTGGGALLRGMTQRLADATAVPVHLVDTPLECVVQGPGMCLESFDRLEAPVHRGRLSRASRLSPPASSAPRRAAPRRPGGPASRGPRRPGAAPARPAGRRSRPAPRWPGAAPWACRRARPARPAGPPDRRSRRARRRPPRGSARRRGRWRPRRAGADGRRHPALGEEPGGADDDQGVGVGERVADERRAASTGSPGPRTGARLHGPPAHRRPARCAGPADVGRGERPGAGQGADAAACTPGSRSASPRRARSTSAGVTGRDDLAPPPGGAAAPAAGFRGRIVASPNRVCPTLTRTAAGERCSHPPPRRPGAAPTLARRRRWPVRRWRVVVIHRRRGAGGASGLWIGQLLRHHPRRRHAGRAVHQRAAAWTTR